ncbi:MAG: relaxase domain-containing protein [Verrucomicrobia bacterium]|nr:relaxase domain-containing protein [Verrucomicrobiota bacterium]
MRRDGTTGTLEPKALYRHQMAAGALFRAELAHALETEVGLRCRREGRSFELLGVDLELMAFFSKRRAAIEAELARTGLSGGRAAEAANFATRQKKESRPRAELFAEWQQIGGEHHWSTKELSWLLEAGFPARDLEGERRSATMEALAALTTTRAISASVRWFRPWRRAVRGAV